MLFYLEAILRNWPPAALSLLLTLAIGGLLWLTHNKLTPFDDKKVLFEDRSVAYLIQRASLVLAFGIAVLPTLYREDGQDLWWALVGQAMSQAWIFVAILLARYVVDYVVLVRIPNTEKLLEGNVSLGIVEAGFYIGFGFILNGSLTGLSPSLGQAIASTVVFGSLGLAVMIGMWWFHELVTPWHLRESIEQDNRAAAFEGAGALAAFGIVVRSGVQGDFTGWWVGFIAFFGTVIVSLATLYLFRWVTNVTILRGYTLKAIQDTQNVTAAAFSAALMVTVAVAVGYVVQYQL